jgi:hypothetical protein
MITISKQSNNKNKKKQEMKLTTILKTNPIPDLRESEDIAISYFSRRDLLKKEVGPIEDIWTHKLAVDILSKQQKDGSWKYPSKHAEERPHQDYIQIETWRQLSYLVEKYGMTREHPSIENAAEFLFTKQTDEGDFRGIYSNQYSHPYTAIILETLIHAGYEKDRRVKDTFDWFLRTQQNEGGWAISFRTQKYGLRQSAKLDEPLQPDKNKPFSHLVTGMVLRAFAAHPKHQRTSVARKAGELLSTRIFEADKYADRRNPKNWTNFSYPYWFTDIASSLDSLTKIGFTSENPGVRKIIDWFREHQSERGLWKVKILRPGKEKRPFHWITLAICRSLVNL